MINKNLIKNYFSTLFFALVCGCLTSTCIFSTRIFASSNEKMYLSSSEDEKKSIAKNKSVLDNIPSNLPPISHAGNVMKLVMENGFNWESAHQVINKVREETKEVEEALTNPVKVKEELGDLLLACITLCVYLKEDPEEILKSGLQKFETRFRKAEEIFQKKNKLMSEAPLSELLEAWSEAKKNNILLNTAVF